MESLIHAIILSLALEGACFALFPGLMRKSMLEALSHDDQELRTLGGMAVTLAIFLAFLLRAMT